MLHFVKAYGVTRESEIQQWMNAWKRAHLHVPLIAGVVLLALGLKKVLEYVSAPVHHGLADPLKGVGLTALVGDVTWYLLGHVAFMWCVLHVFNVQRAVLAVLVAFERRFGLP
ncbi:low temperature requirement protein A [Streptomyces cavernicola]|uniref:Low temperature requirement protein A n=1 Tax=Streptomyces cavernicola TaxID=3043613 RepID=A0ABT6S521_9ACTN|nr:low temperature requirement protein A [Streptomyces sp. B-S-A6]MDI3403190.1 low temperature requirement protein A [Streptomyces sp. B-S-A6]